MASQEDKRLKESMGDDQDDAPCDASIFLHDERSYCLLCNLSDNDYYELFPIYLYIGVLSNTSHTHSLYTTEVLSDSDDERCLNLNSF